ncbi:MAG: squalene/phytoene synthase family protein [Alphaproteobacteria bacterium]|nr:squalene/phytoene synthase family protein [Alphaproteobacteria bacterium]
MPKPVSYCAEIVRSYDRDRYLTALFAPSAQRAALLALYAFNLEVARTREAVRTPEMGLIRLQWWREAIAELYAGNCRQHPVLEELAPLAPRLSRGLIDRLLDAREHDLAPEPFATLDDLAVYGRTTAGVLLELALELLDAADPSSRKAAHALGTGWALLGLLRSTPIHARAGRTMLPSTLLRDGGLDPGALLAARGTQQMASVVREVAERARREISSAREADIVPAAQTPLLLGPLADAILRRLQAVDYDPWRLPLRISFAPLRLAVAHWRGRF